MTSTRFGTDENHDSMTTPSAPSDRPTDPASVGRRAAGDFSSWPRSHLGARSRRAAREDPKLISRLTPFTVFSVYLLDEQRQELSIAYAVGYPEEVVKHFTLQVGQGIGRHGGGRAAADPAGRRRPGPALPGRSPGTSNRSWRCRCAQGQGDRRAQPAERSSSTRSPSATSGSCGSSAPTSRRPSSTPGCSSRSASTPRRSRRWPRSAAR